MKYFFSPKVKWVLLICFLTGLFVYFVYHYNSQIWAKGVRFYTLLYDRNQLKGIIRSYGAYSPVTYIFLQMIQVVIAPIPGGAIEFIGGYLFGAKAGFLYSMIGLFIGFPEKDLTFLKIRGLLKAFCVLLKHGHLAQHAMAITV